MDAPGIEFAFRTLDHRAESLDRRLAECAAITGFFRTEIDRIIADLSDPFAP